MGKDGPDSIIVPDEELARQATDAIAGFGYQLFQTISAWMSLKPGERLFVEMAEDFAVSTGTALTMMQVKRTAATVTLRSKGIAALISALWTFQEANPGKQVSAAFLTTSKIGKERGLSFPNRAAGLTYWRVGAREQTEIEPLRAALASLDLPDSLKTFLKTASPDDIRNRILRPIHWYTAAPSAEALERDIEDRLVTHGQARGVGARDARNALSALVVELLRCIRRPPETRYVTASDFATVFEGNTYRLVPPNLLGGLPFPGMDDPFAPTPLQVSDAAGVPLPPRAALRQDAVAALHAALVTDGMVWLHGSSGLGKTTMALLIARRQNAAWQFADLRDLDRNGARLTLNRIAASFAASGARGLILDDVPADSDNATILAMRRVARAVAEADGVLVVTSTKPPAPSLQSGIDLKSESITEIPYLTETDIGEMIARAGGDVASWLRPIALSTGGHPQLVDARIMGLHRRGWPKDDRWSDVLTRDKGDVEKERQTVRSRLLQEMDAPSREVLFRLSLLTNAFDRNMALAAASAAPAIRQAGLMFDTLIGPWIEQVGPERYRLSQLLRDSGDAALDKGVKPLVREAVLEYLLGQRPFPGDQLMQLFILAFVLRHGPALRWFSAALVSTAYRDKPLFKRLAEEVSVFAQANPPANGPLFPEDLNISTMLRYAQLLVAIANNDLKAACRALDRGLAEAALLDGEFKSNTLCLIISSALMERTLPLAPSRWHAMLRELDTLPGVRELLHKRPKHNDPFSGLIVTPSHEEVFFVVRATALTSIAELAELIAEMDKLPAETRSRYIGAAAAMAHSTTHIVASAWLADVVRPGFDAKAAAETLAALREAVKPWGNADIAVELACAHAVMLDEYVHDETAALAVLAEAQGDYPDDYRINRQRQKVYYRNGKHAQALKEFEIFAKSLNRASPVESAFVLREAGRSASEIGELGRARDFFGRAWEALGPSGDHILPFKAGLSGDCAILDYQAGRHDEAIALMVRALTESEAIDPAKGLKEHYCKLILVSALLWMRGNRADWPVEQQAMVIGMCSNPDPLPEIAERPLPQPQLAWYQLAELEADESDKTVALAALRQRTKGGRGLLPMETMLSAHLLQAATRRLDVDGFLDALRIYPRAVDIAVASLPDRKAEDILNMPTGNIPPLAGKQWLEPGIQESVRSSILLFLLAALSQGRRDVYDALRAHCSKTAGLNGASAPLFALIDDPPETSTDAVGSVAKVVNQMLDDRFLFDAMDAFGAIVVIVQMLAGHASGETVAVPVLGYFRTIWQDILAHRTFSMRHPSVTGPLILGAFDKGVTAKAALAHVALAAEHAINGRFSDELRTTMHRIAEPVRKPVEYIDFSAKPKT